MHGMAYLLALEHQKKLPITAESNICERLKSPPRKNHVFLSFFFCPERGCFTDRWELEYMR